MTSYHFAMTLTALNRPSSLVESVCEQLAAIIRGEKSAEDRWLPAERLLAEQLGVSRTVVREATKRLEQQGMLEIQHGAGIKIVDKLHKPLNGALNTLVPNEKDRLAQLTEIRVALEPENARYAAQRGSAASLKALKACHERFTSAESVEAQVQADMDFHCLLADASGNRIASLLIQSLSELLQASLTHGYNRVTKDQAVKDHSAVLVAVLKHDGDAAANAMRQHLLNARDDLGLKSTSRR